MAVLDADSRPASAGADPLGSRETPSLNSRGSKWGPSRAESESGSPHEGVSKPDALFPPNASAPPSPGLLPPKLEPADLARPRSSEALLDDTAEAAIPEPDPTDGGSEGRSKVGVGSGKERDPSNRAAASLRSPAGRPHCTSSSSTARTGRARSRCSTRSTAGPLPLPGSRLKDSNLAEVEATDEVVSVMSASARSRRLQNERSPCSIAGSERAAALEESPAAVSASRNEP